MAALFTKRNQLQWLALLAAVVVLPTVSLLWFMSRVISNERLVVQEKLRVLYQDKLADATVKTGTLLKERLAALETMPLGGNPYALFNRLVLENHFQGAVSWAADGSILWPRAADAMGNTVDANSPIADAWQAEFSRRDFAEAAEIYGRFTLHSEPRVALAALTGRARCLSRQGNLDEAIAECQKAAFTKVPADADPALRLAVENARLLLLSLLKQSGKTPANTELFRKVVDALMDDLYNAGTTQAVLPANQNLFIAQKVLDALDGPFSYDNTDAKAKLQKLASAESLSIAAAEALQPFSGQFDTIFKTRLGETQTYGVRHQLTSATMLVLLSETGIQSLLGGYDAAFNGSEAAYRVLDAAGEFVAGSAEPQGAAFNVASLPAGFPGWKVELYFEGGDVFEKAAARQIAVYTWTGVLVILLILIVSALAMRAIGRQIRLNEMKNDFIATVSHELKTPLASMRVLVDTLLEGNVRDEAQVKQYLQLTSRENERLSRMIDNFLTFSRMERNKVAFNLTDASPAHMASDAIEVVKTKFETHHCHLDLDIADNLPGVQADHDALVTVLVNLLDNACKYTGENKRVSFRVFMENGHVCFAVGDNGIGIARRHLRRIFDRFYQVDSSLARKAEGCGLGLSIVKFIVDAHNGSIDVESRPDQGSTFSVRLPIGRHNGD